MARTKKDFDKEAMYKKLMPSFLSGEKNTPQKSTLTKENSSSTSIPKIDLNSIIPQTSSKLTMPKMDGNTSIPKMQPPPAMPSVNLNEVLPKPATNQNNISPIVVASPVPLNKSAITSYTNSKKLPVKDENVATATDEIQKTIIIEKFQEESFDDEYDNSNDGFSEYVTTTKSEQLNQITTSTANTNNIDKNLENFHIQLPSDKIDNNSYNANIDNNLDIPVNYDIEKNEYSDVRTAKILGSDNAVYSTIRAKNTKSDRKRGFLNARRYSKRPRFCDYTQNTTYNEGVYKMNDTNSKSPVEKCLSEVAYQPEKLVVHNAMEDLVIYTIKSLANEYNCCMCEQCVSDMAAIALNVLKPKYIAAKQKEIVEKTLNFVETTDINIKPMIIQAILKVKSNPRH